LILDLWLGWLRLWLFPFPLSSLSTTNWALLL